MRKWRTITGSCRIFDTNCPVSDCPSSPRTPNPHSTSAFRHGAFSFVVFGSYAPPVYYESFSRFGLYGTLVTVFLTLRVFICSPLVPTRWFCGFPVGHHWRLCIRRFYAKPFYLLRGKGYCLFAFLHAHSDLSFARTGLRFFAYTPIGVILLSTHYCPPNFSRRHSVIASLIH